MLFPAFLGSLERGFKRITEERLLFRLSPQKTVYSIGTYAQNGVRPLQAFSLLDPRVAKVIFNKRKPAFSLSLYDGIRQSNITRACVILE